MEKVTFLVLHLNYGGIERQVTTLANSLVDEYEVEIISIYDILGKSFYPLDSRVKVKYILPYGPNQKELLQALKKVQIGKFSKELKKSIKLLYTRYFHIGKIVEEIDTNYLVSSRIEFSKQIKRDDIVIISQEHSYINTPSYKRKVTKSFSHVDYLIVMTKKAKEQYDLWLKECKKRPRVMYIPNMIEDPKEEVNIDLNSKQIISIGRLEEVKDFPALIEVFHLVQKEHPDWTLKIVGEGSQRKKLEKMIKELGLNDKVILTGRLSGEKIEEELNHSAIFALTSVTESFSLGLVEAMAHYLPCVSYEIEVGPKEIISDQEDGFLIKDRSKVEMAKKINELIEDRVQRVEIGNLARKKAEQFFASHIKTLWKGLFHKDN